MKVRRVGWNRKGRGKKERKYAYLGDQHHVLHAGALLLGLGLPVRRLEFRLKSRSEREERKERETETETERTAKDTIIFPGKKAGTIDD